MRRTLRITLLVVGISAVVGGGSLWAAQRLGWIPKPEAWGRFEAADPARPPTLEEIERNWDSHGPLRGRVRRAADGGVEIRYPTKHSRTAGSVLLFGFIALSWGMILRARHAPEADAS